MSDAVISAGDSAPAATRQTFEGPGGQRYGRHADHGRAGGVLAGGRRACLDQWPVVRLAARHLQGCGHRADAGHAGAGHA